MRVELYNVAQLERHARTMAGWHEVTTTRGRGGDRLLERLSDNEDVLRDAYELLTAAVTRGRQITPAAEWLIDNFHLIEQQVMTARQHLPKSNGRGDSAAMTEGPVAWSDSMTPGGVKYTSGRPGVALVE